MSARHGESRHLRAARELAEAGKREANEKLASSGRTVWVPLPCFCDAGVKRTKAGHADPNYDGRHYHQGMWDEFERQCRKTDLQPKFGGM